MAVLVEYCTRPRSWRRRSSLASPARRWGQAEHCARLSKLLQFILDRRRAPARSTSADASLSDSPPLAFGTPAAQNGTRFARTRGGSPTPAASPPVPSLAGRRALVDAWCVAVNAPVSQRRASRQLVTPRGNAISFPWTPSAAAPPVSSGPLSGSSSAADVLDKPRRDPVLVPARASSAPRRPGQDGLENFSFQKKKGDGFHFPEGKIIYNIDARPRRCLGARVF